MRRLITDCPACGKSCHQRCRRCGKAGEPGLYLVVIPQEDALQRMMAALPPFIARLLGTDAARRELCEGLLTAALAEEGGLRG